MERMIYHDTETDEPMEDHYALLVKAWEQKVFPTIRRRFRNEAERKDGLEQIRGALQLGKSQYTQLLKCWPKISGILAFQHNSVCSPTHAAAEVLAQDFRNLGISTQQCMFTQLFVCL